MSNELVKLENYAALQMNALELEVLQETWGKPYQPLIRPGKGTVREAHDMGSAYFGRSGRCKGNRGL